MKEWDRTDVRGVSIINHQRNLHALERNNQNVFTQPQIQDAMHHDITILTTWDLFLLLRGMMEWEWDPNVIQELFYRSGRMPRYPSSATFPIYHINKHSTPPRPESRPFYISI